MERFFIIKNIFSFISRIYFYNDYIYSIQNTMKKPLILTTLWLLCLSLSLPTYAYTDAEVDAKATEIKWLVKLIFAKPKDKEKYQYVFKDIFAGCAKTCKNEFGAIMKLFSTFITPFEKYDVTLVWLKLICLKKIAHVLSTCRLVKYVCKRWCASWDPYSPPKSSS